MATFKYLMWLSLKNEVSFGLRHKILNHFGDITSVFMADRQKYNESGFLSKKQIDALCDKDLIPCDIVLEKCERLGINVVAYYDSAYPELLRNIDDAPLILYMKGQNINLSDKLMIAMVGTRKATPYGISASEKLAFELCKNNVIIVSGMAEGIDRHAHLGALRAGGQTIAVVGCGVDICYPMSNRILRDDILATGLIISEYPPGTPVDGKNFPIRNRIISGMTYGTIVVEAPVHSGALITSRRALEQGREVFAVPGNIDSVNSSGCNRLIYEGATLISNAENVLEQFEWLNKTYKKVEYIPSKFASQPKKTQNENKAEEPIEPIAINKKTSNIDLSALNDVQSKIYQAIADGFTTNDEIIEQTKITASAVMSNITMLEVQGIICHKNGKLAIK